MSDHENASEALPPLAARNKYGVSEVVAMRMQPTMAAEIDGFVGVDGFKSRSEFLRNAVVHYCRYLRINGVIGNEIAKLTAEAEDVEAMRASCHNLEQQASKQLFEARTEVQKTEAREFSLRVVKALADKHYDTERLARLIEDS